MACGSASFYLILCFVNNANPLDANRMFVNNDTQWADSKTIPVFLQDNSDSKSTIADRHSRFGKNIRPPEMAGLA
jgi:hypothetical protein